MVVFPVHGDFTTVECSKLRANQLSYQEWRTRAPRHPNHIYTSATKSLDLSIQIPLPQPTPAARSPRIQSISTPQIGLSVRRRDQQPVKCGKLVTSRQDPDPRVPSLHRGSAVRQLWFAALRRYRFQLEERVGMGS